MDGRGGAWERLQGLLADLIGALCRDDVRAVEQATANLQQFLDTELLTDAVPVDAAALLTLRHLLDTAQCLVWARLVAVASHTEVRPLVAERV